MIVVQQVVSWPEKGQSIPPASHVTPSRVPSCDCAMLRDFWVGSVACTHSNDEVAARGLALTLDDGGHGLDMWRIS